MNNYHTGVAIAACAVAVAPWRPTPHDSSHPDPSSSHSCGCSRIDSDSFRQHRNRENHFKMVTLVETAVVGGGISHLVR